MSKNSNYLVLAYYHFTPIQNPYHEVKRHKDFFTDRDVTCRIYISEQGINGQMSGLKEDAEKYMEWLKETEGLETVVFKIHTHHENVFPRIAVKYRKQLVAIDSDWQLSNRGEHVSSGKWKEMLDSQEKKILIDVRNDYEWKVGHFEGAEMPPCQTFRDFSAYAEQLKETNDPEKTPVMMYCTGGIRCELYSSILKDKGFDKVYQLDGGVIGYGLQEGNKHWLGKLFVFDDRLAVPISNEGPESPVIGTCHHCATPNELYYNCANMNCNDLFLCCPDCLKQFQGCCCSECMESTHIRPYHEQETHKPFRRRHHYEKHLPKKVKT